MIKAMEVNSRIEYQGASCVNGEGDYNEKILKALQKNNIEVFPGFEIFSSEKIHIVCLYEENTEQDTLNQYLGRLMGVNINKLADEPTHPSSFSCQDIAKFIIKEQKGFWYAAHATGNSGLLKLSKAGDNYNNLWKEEDLVIAVQIPGTVEDLEVGTESLHKYKMIIENKNDKAHTWGISVGF